MPSPCNNSGHHSPAPLFAHKRVSAFTLVEVTLTIGIVAFAVLSMVALMPVGLKTMKDSADVTVSAQILDRISSTAQRTPFGTQLDAFVQTAPLYFDRSGRSVSSVNDAFFSAALSPAAIGYPGAPSDLSPKSAIMLEITISVLKPGTSSAMSSNKSAIIIPKS